MSKSCKGLLKEYIKCLSESDCVKEEGKDIRACNKDTPPECLGIRSAYFTCKRGQVDGTKRIRGNKGF